MNLYRFMIFIVLFITVSACCDCKEEDYRFNTSEIVVFEITSHSNGDSISCPGAEATPPCVRDNPTNAFGQCQFEINGESQGITEQVYDGFIYALVRSTDPKEDKWHVQHPNTLPDKNGSWTIILQYGSDQAPFIPCENDRFSAVTIVTAYKETMDEIETVPEPFLSNLKKMGVEELLASSVVENLTIKK